MKHIWIIVLLAVLIAGFAHAAEKRGTRKEAQTMVKKAVTYLKANGKEKAFAEFGKKKGQFFDRDLFIFVIDMNGKMLVHGANPALNNKDLIALRDTDGTLLIKNMVDLAKAKGNGWSDYRWTNPVTKKVEHKSSYIQKVDDVLVGCGVFTLNK